MRPENSEGGCLKYTEHIAILPDKSEKLPAFRQFTRLEFQNHQSEGEKVLPLVIATKISFTTGNKNHGKHNKALVLEIIVKGKN